MIPISEEKNKFHEEQDVCHICKRKFYLDENENDENVNDKNDEKFKKYQKVKDHCPYTQRFRGAAHNYCNLRYKLPKIVGSNSNSLCWI